MITRNILMPLFAKTKYRDLTDRENELLYLALDDVKVNELLSQLNAYNETAYKHCINTGKRVVKIICRNSKKVMDVEETDLVECVKGALLIDIGYLKIPKELLKKKNLTSDEFKIIKNHIVNGREILEENGFSEKACNIVENHHERYDGSGYLKKKWDNTLDTDCTIVIIADTFEAMREQRPFRDCYSLLYTINQIMQAAGICFSQRSVEMLLNSIYG